MPPRTDAERQAWITRTLDPDLEVPPDLRTDEWVRQVLEENGFVIFTDLPWIPAGQAEVNRIAEEGWRAWWDANGADERRDFDFLDERAMDVLFLAEELTELRQRGAAPEHLVASQRYIATLHATALAEGWPPRNVGGAPGTP